MPIARGTTQISAKRKIVSPVKDTSSKRQRNAFCNLTNYTSATRLKEKTETVKQIRVSDGVVEESEESLYVSALDNLPEDTSINSGSGSNSSTQSKKFSGIPVTKPCTRLSTKLNAENKQISVENDENQPSKLNTRQNTKPTRQQTALADKQAPRIIVKPTTKIAPVKAVTKRAVKSVRTTVVQPTDDLKRSTRSAAKTVVTSLTIENKIEVKITETSNSTDEESRDGGTVALPVPDFDKACQGDVHQVAEYAHDIFLYMKGREERYRIKPYMHQHPNMTTRHRAQLVDILVQLQEHLELTHETLYLAVYLLDTYLAATYTAGGHSQPAGRLELVRAQLSNMEDFKKQWKHWRLFAIAAMLLACKFEERCAPHLDEFVYCVSGNVTGVVRNRLIRAEAAVWRASRFELGVPLSYRFLRRYARCVYTPMDTLTLARYVLELSLLDYDISVGLGLSVSRLAAAALWLARRMHFAQKKNEEIIWNRTLQFYSGYTEENLKEIIYKLNELLYNQKDVEESEDDEDLATIKHKYSHRVFFKVAETPLIPSEQLVST